MFDTSEDLFVHAVDDKQGDVRKRRGGKERVVFGSVAREKKVWIGYGDHPLDKSHTVLLLCIQRFYQCLSYLSLAMGVELDSRVLLSRSFATFFPIKLI